MYGIALRDMEIFLIKILKKTLVYRESYCLLEIIELHKSLGVVSCII